MVSCILAVLTIICTHLMQEQALCFGVWLVLILHQLLLMATSTSSLLTVNCTGLMRNQEQNCGQRLLEWTLKRQLSLSLMESSTIALVTHYTHSMLTLETPCGLP